MTLNKTDWNTYRTTAYTHQVGTDRRAEGGVHHFQVRWTPTGWQRRILECNGDCSSSGPIEAIPEAEGEALFARACEEN